VCISLGRDPDAVLSCNPALVCIVLPSRIRSAQLLLMMFLFSLGTVAEAGIAWIALPGRSEDASWRSLMRLSAVPAWVALLANALWLPESPRWLLSQGRQADAAKMVAHVRSWDGPSAPSPSDPATVLADGQETPTTLSCASGVGVLCSSKAHMRCTTALLCALYFLMALVYYYLVLVTPALVSDSAADTDACASLQHDSSMYWRSLVASAAEIPGLAAAAWLLERWGRRLTISAFFGATAAVALVIGVAGTAIPPNASLVLTFASRASALGFNQSLWVYTTEVYPTTVRATGLGATTLFARIGGLLSPALGQILFATSPAASLFVCAGSASAAAALTLALPMETLGRDLTDTSEGG
jgi:MFS transporter, putative metabolite:H+ symporter